VSDTSWEGYEEIPRLIMAGYTRVFEEAAAQWTEPPHVVFVQGGVGGLVAAAASWFAWTYRGSRPYLIACEPESAACLLASARAGAPTSIGVGPTMMAGLRCGRPSPAAWPAIARGVDAFMAIPDELCVEALEALGGGEAPILAGSSGACGVGALLAAARAPELRARFGIERSTRVLAVVTEAA
jgi:diaminopropionate ammonia-lyase